MTTPRTIRQALATALLTAGLAGATTSPTTSPAAASLPYADQRETKPVPTTATVTADQLGPDSTIAVVTHGNLEKPDATGLARSLEVITPDGVRHPVYSVELEESRHGWFHGDFLIADWRPELHTALLRVSLGARGDKAVAYDVVTGATHEVTLPPGASTIGLDPDGSGILMTTYPTERRSGRVVKQVWSGTTSGIPGWSDGAVLTSIDGRTLVSNEGSRKRWWIIDIAARTNTAISTPGDCQPRRWLDADSVIATCSNRRGSQLRRIDLDGTSSRLGIRHTERTRSSGPGVFDDGDVRTVHGRSWFESYGGCGGAFLTRQTPAGEVRMVRVPGQEGALSLVGTRGDRLVIAHEKDDCASTRTRGALALFDPVTRDEVVLTRLARDEAWREILSATEVRSWIW